MISPLRIKDFTYDLPENRIAKFPLEKREMSKLLCFKNGRISDHVFTEAPGLLPNGSQLVFNNTKVVQARLLFTKTEGAKPIEVFCLEPIGQEVEMAMAAKREVNFYCLVGNAKRWNDGLTLAKELDVNGNPLVLRAQKGARQNDAFVISFSWDEDITFAEILEHAGKVPLPPYLNRASEQSDKDRYQTVYAKLNGSVAAPTAGLHFTPGILQTLQKRGIKIAETTLHVGAGTFKPVSSEEVQDHEMHAEELHITKELLQDLLDHNGPRFCVGTTSARTLESLYWLGVKWAQNPTAEASLSLLQWDAYTLPQDVSVQESLQNLLAFLAQKGSNHFFTHTQLMIAPGYTFRMIDGLFTNFHQPGSTLILLVAAAVGQSWKTIYQHALDNEYRFLSYGDSSLLFIEKQH